LPRLLALVEEEGEAMVEFPPAVHGSDMPVAIAFCKSDCSCLVETTLLPLPESLLISVENNRDNGAKILGVIMTRA
jgi:hypothetical protein